MIRRGRERESERERERENTRRMNQPGATVEIVGDLAYSFLQEGSQGIMKHTLFHHCKTMSRLNICYSAQCTLFVACHACIVR